MGGDVFAIATKDLSSEMNSVTLVKRAKQLPTSVFVLMGHFISCNFFHLGG